MNIKITSRDLEVTEAIKNYIETKAERLKKYFDTEDFDVYATIKTERELQVAEISLRAYGAPLRAVTAHKDLYASIDKDIDILEGQVRKLKTKLDKQNMTESIRVKEESREVSEDEMEDEILKTLYYDIKPMGAEDAKLLLKAEPQNSFKAFINIDTGKVNVIYKLKDGKNFGLVEPEA